VWSLPVLDANAAVPSEALEAVFFKVTAGFDISVCDEVNVIVMLPAFAGSGVDFILLNVGDGFGHPTVNNGKASPKLPSDPLESIGWHVAANPLPTG
jgi:hypothetical protein